MNENFKRFLTFSKSERIAIISITSLIVIILITKYLIILNPPKRTAHFHNLDSIIDSRQREIDSLMTLDSIQKSERRAAYAKRRNDDSKMKANGRKTWQSDFKKEAKRRDSSDYQSFKERKTTSIVDINAADTTGFKELPGIGSSFARRIVEYRGKLGGFIEKEQLLEVYGMDSTRYDNIKDYIIVDSVFHVNKLRINYDSFKVLNKHPYLKYEDVKKIVNYREQRGMITTWEQLEKVVGKELEPRSRKYIKFEE